MASSGSSIGYPSDDILMLLCCSTDGSRPHSLPLYSRGPMRVGVQMPSLVTDSQPGWACDCLAVHLVDQTKRRITDESLSGIGSFGYALNATGQFQVREYDSTPVANLHRNVPDTGIAPTEPRRSLDRCSLRSQIGGSRSIHRDSLSSKTGSQQTLLRPPGSSHAFRRACTLRKHATCHPPTLGEESIETPTIPGTT
jgi:hypothetical protein